MKSVFTKTSCAASAVLLALFLASCGTTAKTAAAPDPKAAESQLAPVVRLAETPSEGVYYSLFVRSFADSNGDGIGDFNGIIEKLDYLNDGSNLPVDFNAPQKSSLGITGIWLLP